MIPVIDSSDIADALDFKCDSRICDIYSTQLCLSMKFMFGILLYLWALLTTKVFQFNGIQCRGDS